MRDKEDDLKFIIEKQVGETDAGYVFELQMKNEDGKSNIKLHDKKQQRGGSGNDRLQQRWDQVRSNYVRTRPGFI